MNSINKTARIAGGLILVTAVLAPFSMIYLPTFPLWLLIKGVNVAPQNHRTLAFA